jgi:hypothetical protein
MKLKRPLVWLMNTRFYEWLTLHVIPYIRLTTYYTSLRGAKYQEGYYFLEPGHIILTVDKKKLTSMLIPGEWAHACLCLESLKLYQSVDPDVYEIAEMTHTNYTKSYFFDICKESDRVVILRCVDWDPEYVKQVVATCRTFEDAVYDTKFDFGVKALYCSELVYQADFEHRLDVVLDDLAGLGRKYISPDGLFKAKNVRIVWDSDEVV